jgi:hypothetical protein
MREITFLPADDNKVVDNPSNGLAGLKRPEDSAGEKGGEIVGGGDESAENADTPSPLTSAVSSNFLPFDLASLERALKQFLDQIRDLGGELFSLLERMNLSPWLVALAVAGVTYEVARRRMRQPQGGLILAGAHAGTLPWFAGLIDPSPTEDS